MVDEVNAGDGVLPNTQRLSHHASEAFREIFNPLLLFLAALNWALAYSAAVLGIVFRVDECQLDPGALRSQGDRLEHYDLDNLFAQH